MSKPLRTNTPQFRTALIRKLKNLAPGYDLEFLDTNSGVSFLLCNASGNACSEPITIARNTGDALQSASLKRALSRAKFNGFTE
jgi:cellulose biosynthesis protein BcsQ